jgi:hypothetical protein
MLQAAFSNCLLLDLISYLRILGAAAEKDVSGSQVLKAPVEAVVGGLLLQSL